MEIQELPDLRQNIEEYYNHDSGGLLDYVWEVANHFIPSYDGEVFQMSQAPAIFCERYHQRNISIEEPNERHKDAYIAT